jgi:excinuclease ABC subunit A
VGESHTGKFLRDILGEERVFDSVPKPRKKPAARRKATAAAEG